jgi:outer membrane protein assembly factor BamB/SAM-dependent methyltransferase
MLLLKGEIAMKTNRFLFTTLIFVLYIFPVVMAQPGASEQQARQILEATNIKGGLIIHIGCGDGKLTAALHADDCYLIHGLGADVQEVRIAREHIRKLGIYGPVSIDFFDGKRLPYTDNLVNLIVAEDVGDISEAELIRVLAPGGVLCAKKDGRWNSTIKSQPKNIDEWTHYLHDASGNAVAHDELVGPPRYVQWVAGPRHTRSHEHIPSIYSLVSTNGRIFYIEDEASIASLRQTPKWYLIARDAFNGIQLWKKLINSWFPHIVNWGQTPRQLQRKLVAVGDRVYVTLGLHAPLTAVDAATGEILRVYQDTRGTEEIILHKGTLLLVIRSVTDERTSELTKWAQLVDGKSPLDKRETAEPLVKRLRATETRGKKSILALDADTGRLLWKKIGADVSGLRTLSLCADGDRVFYQNGRDVVCVELSTGEEQWLEASAPLRMVYDGGVFCVDGKNITVLSAKTGETKWTQAPLLTEIRDVFVAGGSLWVGGFKPFPTKRGPSWGPYFATQRDLSTGKMLMHVEPENPGHHHRCYSNKATDRYILGGRRGTEFIDLKSGDVLWNSWARGVCKYGVMPCNGLLYTPPHACGCYVGVKLSGFHALASERDSVYSVVESNKDRIERGPAYKRIINRQSSVNDDSDWPIYRYDSKRSGCTSATVPAVLHCEWQVGVGRKITAPTVADGKVFVASVDEHKVCAIDADSGKPIWSFTTSSCVDSAPTIYRGSVIFGSRDGYVYCLRASDGKLAWRLRTARDGRLITACGRLESASPVHGSVLVCDGVVYSTAGRSSYLDGGIDLYRIDPEAGKILSKTPIYSPDPETGKQPPQFAPSAMPGARADILTSDESCIYLRDMVFDKNGTTLTEGNAHLFTLTDFLDDTWPHRSYWIFGKRCSVSTGCSGRDRNLIFGRLLLFNESMIYGYGRKQVHWSNQLQDGSYRLFALKRDDAKSQWTKPVKVHVRAMVLADKVLFVAGPGVDEYDGQIDLNKNRKAILMAISASDGTELARYQLDSTPVFDGMAAAHGRLYVSMQDGSLLCMSEN